MSSTNSSLLSATLMQNFDCPLQFHVNPCFNSTVLWRNVSKQGFLRTPRLCVNVLNVQRPYSCFLGVSRDSVFVTDKLKFRPFDLNLCKNLIFPELGFCRNVALVKEDVWERPVTGGSLSVQSSFNGICPKGYAGLVEAEAIGVDCDFSVLDELQGLVEEFRKEEKRVKWRAARQRKPKAVAGMSPYRYRTLRDRQMKLETETWEKAVNEYKELLSEMCKNSLAPNLPYVKSLILGWFEPLRDRILEEQELIRQGKCRAGFAPYFDHLPADKMAVITMHKLMVLLMNPSGHGTVTVVRAACAIGDAVEEEVRIHKFLEKTKKMKKKKKKKKKGEQDKNSEDAAVHEQRMLRENVDNLMKKQKRRQALKIVTAQDDLNSWGLEAKAKVGSHLIELLIQTAFIQTPPSQLGDHPPELRPAFVHSSRMGPENKRKAYQRYGVIKCDPLVLKGLEETPRHIVITGMPMLVPPEQWTGYDKGAYLVLRSHVMRTRGSKRQREAVKRAPKKQLELVFEALDTLGNTKWRVNDKVLSVVERIWATGGRLADMVDRDDVPLPDQPDTEDESVLQKWKRKVRSAKKENRERHALRCDVELKLAVSISFLKPLVESLSPTGLVSGLDSMPGLFVD